MQARPGQRKKRFPDFFDKQKTSLCFSKHGLVFLFSEIQKIFRRDFQGISYGKKQVKRKANRCCFNSTYMWLFNLKFICQLILRVSFQFSIIRNIETYFNITVLIIPFHSSTSFHNQSTLITMIYEWRQN